LFGGESNEVADSVVRTIDDAEDSFRLGHLNGHAVNQLPESLIEAIRVFLLANAIRDLNGDSSASRSMLINVSRFNSVQQELGELVSKELARYRNAARMHASAYGEGVPNVDLAEIQVTFDREYSNEASWGDVLGALSAAVTDIEVRVVNAKRDKEYEERQLKAENPPRTIAIGGDLLSRGLTLEGLMTSYFYRRVAASDTLMQMGRWFGYRDSYENLSRVWITEELIADYASTADSIDELRAELVRMKDQGLTPRQYGLAVKNHPSSLLITARNKMRAAALGQRAAISLRGRRVETSKVTSVPAAITANRNALDGLVSQLHSEFLEIEERHGRATRISWRGVPKELISSFLRTYKAPTSMLHFSGGALADFVGNAPASDLQTWDVLLVGGEGGEDRVGGIDFKRAVRALGEGEGMYTVSGARRRLAGAGDVAVLMNSEQKKRAEEDFRSRSDEEKKSVPDTAYVPYLERPLLIVYPIQGVLENKTKLPETLVGVLVAIPERLGPNGYRAASEDRSADVLYMLNTPAQRLWAAEYGDELGDYDED
jgi:hypothetical protein